jgi:tetratricopeptide (TPR) repeat protein
MNWNPSLRNLLAVCALCMLAVAAYHNSFRSGFVLDNRYIIAEDDRLQAVTWDHVKLIFTEDYWYPRGVGAIYRPITTLSFLFDYSILGHGQNPAGYHWINLILHLLNVALVYFLTLKLLGRPWPAFAAAALFAVHPVATESVTNLVGRSDLFATATVLGGILIYIHAVRQSIVWRWVWLVLLILVTAIGLLCKESAVVIVAILPIYDLAYRLRRSAATWAAELWAAFKEYFLKGYVVFVPLLIGLFALRHYMYMAHGPSPMAFQDNPLRNADFFTARLTAIKVIGYYLWLLVNPVNLSCDYAYNQVPVFAWRLATFEDWKTPLSAILLVALLGVAIAARRRKPALCFFILFFFLALMPTSNLIILIDSNMAERFLYLPMVGFVGCAAVLVDCLVPPRPVSWRHVLHPVTVALAAVVVLLGIRTVVRNRDWESNFTLYSHDARVVPQSARIHRQCSFALHETFGAARLDEAIDEAERAVEILQGLPPEDDDLLVYIYLGNNYGEKGDAVAHSGGPDAQSAAEVWYRKSIRVLERARAIDEAQIALNYRRARERGKRPNEIAQIGQYQVYQNLGAGYSRLGMHAEAERAYRTMVRFKSDDRQDKKRLGGYVSLASEEYQLGRLDEAAIVLIEGLLLGDANGPELQALAGLYGPGNPGEPPPVLQHDGQSQLNPENPLVSVHITRACERLLETALRTQQIETARSVYAFAVKAKCDMREMDTTMQSYGLDPSTPPSK